MVVPKHELALGLSVQELERRGLRQLRLTPQLQLLLQLELVLANQAAVEILLALFGCLVHFLWAHAGALILERPFKLKSPLQAIRVLLPQSVLLNRWTEAILVNWRQLHVV